jgi:hypothetical protein
MASVGHDAYTYYEEPDKGFRLSDLGSLWDKYHKESHDQWKTKVQEVGQSVSDLMPERIIPENIEKMLPEGLINEKKETPPEQPKANDEGQMVVEEVLDEPSKPVDNNFSEGFTQTIARDGKSKIANYEPENNTGTIGGNTHVVISTIGFLLEQKALFVLGAIPLFFFILNLILSPLFKEKEEMSKIPSLKKKKRKGGGYTYGRK